jgi:hypothetical protein
VVNDVQRQYNGLRQLPREYQEQGGALNGSSLYVDYLYADGSANTIRRDGCVYPNGRNVEYLYDASANDQLSRVGSIVEGAPSDGLVAFWKLDEDVSSGARADSADGISLPDENSDVGVAAGLFSGGKAAHFDAAHSPNTLLRNMTPPAWLSFGDQDFSTCGWVYLDSVPASQFTGIWGKGNSGNSTFGMQEWVMFINTSGHYSWLIADGGANDIEVDSGIAATTGGWHFLAGGYDSANDLAWIQVDDNTPVSAGYSHGSLAGAIVWVRV